MLFFVLGLPCQLLTIILYPIAALWFLLYARPKFAKNNPWVMPEFPDAARMVDELKSYPIKIRDGLFCDIPDTHSLLFHSHLYMMDEHRQEGLLAANIMIESDGSLIRHYPIERKYDAFSNDAHTGWMLAVCLFEQTSKDHENIWVTKVAKHFLKNCFGIRDKSYGFVSGMDSCGGVNLVENSARLCFPAVGVYFFTGIAQLALAAHCAPKRQKIFWEILYHLYFWLMGGFFQSLVPNIHSAKDARYYTQHITMTNLYILMKLRPKSLWWKTATKALLKFNHPHGNINPYFHTLAYDAGIDIDRGRVVRTILASNFSDVFMWQSEPFGKGFFKGDGVERFPIAKLSLLHLLKAV